MAPSYQRDAAFECGVCVEDKAKGQPHVFIAGDPVCKECCLTEIKPQFYAALEHEALYPGTWGSTELSPSDLPDITAAFKMKWQRRFEEYQVPVAQRIYCRQLTVFHNHVWSAVGKAEYAMARRQEKQTQECHNYLGVKSVEEESEQRCRSCKGVTCLRCGTPLRTKKQLHTCDPGLLNGQDDIDRTLVQGVDYQECPNEKCRRRWGLLDGCNAMICSCRTHFCYICGKSAHHDGDHWRKGGCPRYNQPGASRARNDDYDATLVVPVFYIDSVRFFEAEAEREDTAEGRQMKLDQAQCYALMGQIHARRKRAARQRRDEEYIHWTTNWMNGTERLLQTLSMNLDIHVFSPETGQAAEGVLQGHRTRREEFLDMAWKLFERHPNLKDLLPDISPLILRYLDAARERLGPSKRPTGEQEFQ